MEIATIPLSDTSIRNAKPRAKPYKIYDSDGLFLIITPTGRKWWRLKFHFGGKEKLLSLGVYPKVTLKEARVRRDQEHKNIAFDVDPSMNRKAMKRAQVEGTPTTIRTPAIAQDLTTAGSYEPRWTEASCNLSICRTRPIS